jgi:hypothetical protein
MTESKLPHANRIEALLREGKHSEAQRLHNEHVAAELERAKSEPINLSDLMAGKEAFVIDEIERSES